MRAELLACVGDAKGALEAIRVSDERGLLDLVWLDRCVLFDAWRSDAIFRTVRGRVEERARRVATALDDPTVTI